jgi:predicted cupin superfamily sugar epimerase
MSARADDLVRLLGLRPHPEGGHYRETHRSSIRGPGGRAALTDIHFLLRAGERSRWHRVDADELWHHLEGGRVELWTFGEGSTPGCTVLGAADADGTRPTAVVPAGTWQAARPLGDYALFACAVAPGFEFPGFRLMADEPSSADRLRAAHPALADLI